LHCAKFNFAYDADINGRSKAMTDNKSRHLFKQWFKDSGYRKGWFADQIGVDAASISRWLGGHTRPQRAVRKRIEQLTDGAVPMEGWDNA